jgi:hypothetical protein
VIVQRFVFTSQSRQQLMEGLALAIQQRRVTYPAGRIVDELETFGYEYNRTGGVKYVAPQGLHDDCVMALALAVEKLGHRSQDGAYKQARTASYATRAH